MVLKTNLVAVLHRFYCKLTGYQLQCLTGQDYSMNKKVTIIQVKLTWFKAKSSEAICVKEMKGRSNSEHNIVV